MVNVSQLPAIGVAVAVKVGAGVDVNPGVGVKVGVGVSVPGMVRSAGWQIPPSEE